MGKKIEHDEAIEPEVLNLQPEEPETICVDQCTLDRLIRHRVYGAMALGLAPIPLLDLVGLTAIQVDLVRVIAKAYGVPFKQNVVKSILIPLVGSVVPTAAAPLMSSLMKVVPVIGLATGAVSFSILGAASTYAVGRVFARHFANGGNLTSFDSKKMSGYFKEKYDEGKNIFRKEKPTPQDMANSEPESVEQPA